MTQYASAIGLITGLMTFGIESDEVEAPGIGQVLGRNIAQGGEYRFGAARELTLPFRQHPLDLLALRVVLRAAQLARNDRKFPRTRVSLDLRFGHVRERPDHDVPAVFRPQLRRHGLEAPAEEHVEEQ